MKQSVAWEPIPQISACVCPYSYPQNSVTNPPQARQWGLSSHTLAIKHEEFHASSLWSHAISQEDAEPAIHHCQWQYAAHCEL